MNKKSSILFQITIFFCTVFILINSLIITQFFIELQTYRMMEIKRFFTTLKTVEKSYFEGISKSEINKKISDFDMELAEISIEEIKSSYDKKINYEDEPINIYFKDGKKYINFKKPLHEEMEEKNHLGINRNFRENIFDLPPPNFNNNIRPDQILLIDKYSEEEYTSFWFILLFIIDVLLIWFYFFIRKKLLPLYDLKMNMIELSKGNFKISTKTDKKDEISQVANEFDNAIYQLRQLRESRNLFLRNIMHELKTPITKGKLVTDFIPEDENKYTLIRVFYRLEYLLSEFSKIEELTSGKIVLEKSSFRAIDILEQAFDILLLDENIIDIHHNSDLMLNVDFELFSIALKNLIDNALKYNTNGNPEIFIEKDLIKIKNKGKKLKKDISEYYKPFNREYENSKDGLGLGLYITNNIVKIHNYTLEYEYLNDFHIFTIKT